MLKGDLTSTPLAPLLLQLAEDTATGCVHISDAAGDEALIYFKAGLVYAVSVPGRRPQLGAKLISSGALAPEALADALEAQRTELQGWRLGELLVHLGYVDQPVVEAFVKEQVHDAIWDLIRWTDGRWRFRKNEKTREDVAPPISVADLLGNLRERGVEWEAISSVVHGPTAVPVLSARGGGAPETTLDPDAWSMLCKIDGERSVAELARDCGYTMFEAGQVLVALVQAGLVDIEEDVELVATAAPEVADAEPVDELYGASTIMSALAAESDGDPAEEEDTFAALARLVTEVAAEVRDEEEPQPAPVDEPSRVPLQPLSEQSFAASLAKVSSALADVLGPTPDSDPFEVPSEMRRPRSRKPAPVAEPESPEAERRRRVRAAAAAELAAAHALAEALRAAQAEEAAAEAVEVPVADVVDLAVVRREAEEAARIEAERQAAEAQRIAAEEEAARIEVERIEAERLAAEEAARLEAERLAAEEAARLEAERLAAEEAARIEAERVEAERLAAEEAARIEAERVEAERLAAEEAARIEAERVEAERLAAEEAARIEAERLAAEEAARVEAERLAAEEAARVEAERLAAERLAAEEAARVEAERLAAEEAARVEAERLAAEIAEAEERAWEEYWQREAAAAAAAAETAARDAEATALLVELSAAPVAIPAQEAPDGRDATFDDDTPAEIREPAAVAVGAPTPMSEMADTAALLRELSSLGLEDDPPPPPAPVAPPRPPAYRPPAAEPKKKKRGLFGR